MTLPTAYRFLLYNHLYKGAVQSRNFQSLSKCVEAAKQTMQKEISRSRFDNQRKYSLTVEEVGGKTLLELNYKSAKEILFELEDY